MDFSELFPERLTIKNLPDGSSLTLMNRDEMGLEDFAKFQALQRRMDKYASALKAPNNEAAANKAAREMDEAFDEGLRWLAADELSDETLAALKMGQKAAIIKKWGEHQGALSPNG